MSYKQMTGNIISATKVEPAGKFKESSASGVWTLQEQYDYAKGDNWPSQANGGSPFGLFVGHGANTGAGITNKILISTAGDATAFGDLSGANADHNATSGSSTTQYMGGASNSVRWSFAGGNKNLGGIS